MKLKLTNPLGLIFDLLICDNLPLNDTFNSVSIYKKQQQKIYLYNRKKALVCNTCSLETNNHYRKFVLD